MNDFQTRVIEEQHDLDEKLYKLSYFIFENPVFSKLPEDEQVRLKEQSRAMALYSVILQDRIDHF